MQDTKRAGPVGGSKKAPPGANQHDQRKERRYLTSELGVQATVKKRLLPLKEVVSEYGVTMWFWRSRIWNGELPYVTMGRKQLIDRADIEEFIRRNKQTNPTYH